MEDAWRDQYPSLMCLVHHRHDTDVIVDCAKRLLDEGKDPSWFEGCGTTWAAEFPLIPCVLLNVHSWRFTPGTEACPGDPPGEAAAFSGLLRGQKGMR